jgi:hypothetical protein
MRYITLRLGGRLLAAQAALSSWKTMPKFDQVLGPAPVMEKAASAIIEATAGSP